MAINFDKALGIHDDALLLRSRRAGVLANNIANADTPGFQARDVDFRSILKQQLAAPSQMRQTDAQHFRAPDIHAGDPGQLMYRVPMQASVDDNSVEMDVEKAEFTRNAMQFNASYTFLNKRFKGLITALKGE